MLMDRRSGSVARPCGYWWVCKKEAPNSEPPFAYGIVLAASARVMLDDNNKQVHRTTLTEQSRSRAVSAVGGPSERLSRTGVRVLVGEEKGSARFRAALRPWHRFLCICARVMLHDNKQLAPYDT